MGSTDAGWPRTGFCPSETRSKAHPRFEASFEGVLGACGQGQRQWAGPSPALTLLRADLAARLGRQGSPAARTPRAPVSSPSPAAQAGPPQQEAGGRGVGNKPGTRVWFCPAVCCPPPMSCSEDGSSPGPPNTETISAVSPSGNPVSQLKVLFIPAISSVQKQ